MALKPLITQNDSIKQEELLPCLDCSGQKRYYTIKYLKKRAFKQFPKLARQISMAWREASITKHKCHQCLSTGIELSVGTVLSASFQKIPHGLVVRFDDGSIWKKGVNWCNIQHNRRIYFSKDDFIAPSDTYEVWE